MKRITGFFLTAALILTAVFQSYAIGRTDEEWARLRDNVLEYNEIDGLIHEYNTAVKKNSYELEDFDRNYGKSNESVKRAYAELANQLYNAVDYGDPTDPQYGIKVGQAISNEALASQYEMQADNITDDYETYKLSFEQAEMTLAQAAKANMVEYYNTDIARQQAQLSVSQLESALNVKQLQLKLGMTTNAEVLSAQEALLNAQKNASDAASRLPVIKKRLQVMCGWKYESDAQIAPLPEPDIARIATLNPANDVQTALNNNYTLRINQRKLSNANGDTSIKTLNATIDSNKQNIAASVYSAYSAVTAALDAYNYAVTNENLQKTNFAAAQVGFASGSVSSLDLKNKDIAAQTAALQTLQAKYSLLTALTNYDYAVAGLAGA